MPFGKQTHLIGSAVVVMTLAACTVGSGEVVVEPRDVGRFDQVLLETSGDVTIQVTGTDSLEIEAESNIQPVLTAEVVDGRLVLGASGSFTSGHLSYAITVAELTGIEDSASGSIVVSSLSANSFDVVVSGSGSIEVSGTCESLRVVVSGSGSFNGEDLVCASGQVEASGSGSATVNATDQLEVDLTGSGSVDYLGEPELTLNDSGSGTVSPR